MKRILLALTIVFSMGACLPLPSLSNPTPVLDVAATSAANVMNAVAQTLTAQPTSTALPPTATLVPSETTETFATSSSPATTIVESPAPGATATFDLVTSTNVPATALPVGSTTLTLTPGVLTYGTLPPAVPFSEVILVNRSKRQAYISLQVVTDKGGPTIIEYPVRGQIKLKAPIGYYTYVAWVGGREMIGNFRLHKGEELTIILYKDRIVIK